MRKLATMTTKRDRVNILQTALDEQRRFHDEITSSFDKLKSRTVYYIGAILATLTFLYAGALDPNKTTRQRLFIPDELYGMLFYFFGVACIIYALFTLTKGARPDSQWNVYSDSTEQRVVGGVDNSMSEEEYLQSLVDGYESHTEMNLRVHDRNSEAMRSAFFPMLIGGIILVVLRFFQ